MVQQSILAVQHAWCFRSLNAACMMELAVPHSSDLPDDEFGEGFPLARVSVWFAVVC